MENLYRVDVAKIRISDSLIELMHKRDFNSISIMDIMEEAEMSRATFYRHFSSKEDVIRYYFDRLIARFKLYDNMNFDTLEDTKRSVAAVLDAIKKNKRILKMIIDAGCGDVILGYVDSQYERPYVLAGVSDIPLSTYIYSGAMYNLMLKWLCEECKTDIVELAAMIMDATQKDRNNEIK